MNWSEYYDLIFKFLRKIDDYQFDGVVCVGKGGFLLGDAVSRYLNIPLSVVMAKSYTRDHAQSDLVLSSIASFDELKGTILIVDDMADSGTTLKSVSELIKNQPNVLYVMTGTLWKKPRSIFKPDFFVQIIPNNEWIVQPFEIIEER